MLMRSFSALAVLLLLLSACNTVSTAHSTGGKPVKDGTWIDDLLEEPDSLIPNASTETFAAMVDYALWAPLVYGTPDGQKVTSGPFRMSESKLTDRYKDLRAGAADSAYFLDVTKAPVYESLSNYTLVADPRTCSFEVLYFDFHNTDVL